MSRFFYDTAIFVYALGRKHPLRAPCREILTRAMRGELRGEASVDLLQELANQRLRRTGDRATAAAAARDAGALCTLHDLTAGDAQRAIELFESHPLDARDAVFAAVALNRGAPTILSPDRAFDAVETLDRVDPADAERVNSLAA